MMVVIMEAGSYSYDKDDDFDGPDDETDEEGNENQEFDGTDVEDGEDDDDEDAFDVHHHDEDAEDDNNPSVEYDSDVFSSDEAYVRAIQVAEEREMAARLLALAGINDREIEDPENRAGNSQVLISLSPHTALSSPSSPSLSCPVEMILTP
ncbi:E3 ubiquitin ligase BIG BROTHER-related-like isoform X3 [Pistacia vera]|uniref:E3 ubiquitin ligase BIG BROTHER-related-like isoform X3 n=1 Tax=Pistacia vera TaxID=55513 RepID=UPI001262BD93|nr:E3 ubiquitin ligase BIG BROTHER-related-like isoform X3 [Pistacia vera]